MIKIKVNIKTGDKSKFETVDDKFIGIFVKAKKRPNKEAPINTKKIITEIRSVSSSADFKILNDILFIARAI